MTERSPTYAERERLDVPHLMRELEKLVPRDGPAGKRKGDRAALAALRRGLGKEPGEAPDVFPVLLPILPEAQLSPQEEWVAYLIASLFALHPVTWPEPTRERWRSNLGASMRRLAEKTESDGPQRRFVALLNSDVADLPHHLRGIVGLLTSAESPIPVDWAQLTWDLLRWDCADRAVQRRWATSFWGGRRAQEMTDEPTSSETE